MADWVSFQENLKNLSSGAGGYAREKIKKTEDMQDALQMLMFKSSIEQRTKKQMMQDLFDMYKQSGYFGGTSQKEIIDTAGKTQEDMGNDLMLMPTFDPDKPFKAELSSQAQLRQKVKEAQGIQAIKPYGDVEAGIISKAELLTPQIDKLIKMLQEGQVYEGLKVPFGASRIAAFGEKGPWQAIKRGFTGGKGRQAGLLLQELKVLAFGEGGKNLTENEKQTAMANINPSYKTEEQWIDGLKRAKALLQRKAELVSKTGKISSELTSDIFDDLLPAK